MAAPKKRKLTDQLITDIFKASKPNAVVIIKNTNQPDIETEKEEDRDALHLVSDSKSKDKKEETKSDLATLREFDLNQEYGPCIGITRLERWNRAQKLGLNPPLNVRQLVEYHALEKSYSDCVWTAYNI